MYGLYAPIFCTTLKMLLQSFGPENCDQRGQRVLKLRKIVMIFPKKGFLIICKTKHLGTDSSHTYVKEKLGRLMHPNARLDWALVVLKCIFLCADNVLYSQCLAVIERVVYGSGTERRWILLYKNFDTQNIYSITIIIYIHSYYALLIHNDLNMCIN